MYPLLDFIRQILFFFGFGSGNYFICQVLRQFFVTAEFHGEGTTSLSHGAKVNGIAVHFGKRSLSLDALEMTGFFHPENTTATGIHIAHDITHELVGNKNFYVHDRFEENRFGNFAAFFESKSDKFEEDINSWEDYFRVYQTQALEFDEDTCGDYKITYRVSKIKDLSERKVKASNESLLSALEEIANFDADTIKEGKYVTVKVKEDTEELGIIRYTYTVTLVKVSNSWKVLDYDVD